MESPDEEARFFDRSLLFFCNFLLLVVFLCGLVANFLALLVFYRKPGLRTTANRFVINLMVINIVSCLSLLPITFIDNTTDTVNAYFLFAEQFSSVFCSSAIVYSVLLIAIDQYFAVVNPLHYYCIISSWKGYLMIMSTWAFCTSLALLSTIQIDFGVFQENLFRHCGVLPRHGETELSNKESIKPSTIQAVTSSFYRVIFCAGFATIAFVIPFGLICFIYYSICLAASGNSKRARTSILSTDDNNQNVKNDSGKSASPPLLKQPETECKSRPMELIKCDMRPSFTFTRASPPKPVRSSDERVTRESETVEEPASPSKAKDNAVKTGGEVPFLKPTLKNNSSFTKLSSLHIQFSNCNEKPSERKERRHSNIIPATADPEFENITKNRSPSMQSNFYEMANASPFNERTSPSSQSRSSSVNSSQPGATRSPPSRTSSIRSTSSYLVNIRHRISNASLFRYREEARAARISAMVIVMALFCWLPFFIIVFLHSGTCSGQFPQFPYYLNPFSVLLLLLTAVVSPFLFAFRNRQIKKEIRKMFQFCPNFSLDCTKLIYTQNFSLSLKSQTVQLLTELGKSTKIKQEKNSVVSVG